MELRLFKQECPGKTLKQIHVVLFAILIRYVLLAMKLNFGDNEVPCAAFLIFSWWNGNL